MAREKGSVCFGYRGAPIPCRLFSLGAVLGLAKRVDAATVLQIHWVSEIRGAFCSPFLQ